MNKIPLTQGKFAIVDDEDYDHLMQWSCHINADGYAVRNSDYIRGEKRTTIQMSREIMNAPHGLKVDHRDTNRLNNRRNNLRFANDLESGRNRNGNKNTSSIYKGVTWMPRLNKWQAQLGGQENGKRKNIYLGVFSSEIEAAKAYNRAAKKLHGEFVKLNKVAA